MVQSVTIRRVLRLDMRGDDTSCYLGVLGGTMRLGVLISRLEVRVLRGSHSNPPALTTFSTSANSGRISESKRSAAASCSPGMTCA